ncbi:MAG: hypothetical protein M3464_20700 [Chloroflexota bacterium]|nr:hypothetical protein [Chloroflexota bacterium]
MVSDAGAMYVSSSPSLQGIVISDSRGQGEQQPYLELSAQGLKTQTALHEQHLQRINAEHHLLQTAKDNDARRDREAKHFQDRRDTEKNIYKVVLIGTVAGLVIGCLAVFLSPDDAIQRWGQSLITLILGALVGYWAASKKLTGDGWGSQS